MPSSGPLAAGKRDRKVVFERATATTDAWNEGVPTWATWCGARASIRFGTSAERREAAAEQGSQAATFRVLATTKTRAVTLEDRVQFDGSAWDIEGIAPIGRIEIEFTAVRAR